MNVQQLIDKLAEIKERELPVRVEWIVREKGKIKSKDYVDITNAKYEFDADKEERIVVIT